MKDRQPTYPGRVELIPVPGRPNTYDLIMADEPIEPGTPNNKANLLADDTAMALGGVDTVNEALGALHNDDLQLTDALAQAREELSTESWLSSWNAFIRNGIDLDVLAAIGKI